MKIWQQVLVIGYLALLMMGCSLPHFVVLEDPLSAQEHLKLGLAYEKQGDFEAAVKEYHLAAKKNDNALLFLGNANFHLGRDDAAEEAYRQAIVRMPENPRPYNNLAWLLCAQGRNLTEAKSLAEQALSLAPAGNNKDYQDTLRRVRESKAGEGPACQRPPKPKAPTGNSKRN